MENKDILSIVLEVLKENETSTGTTKYSTNIAKPAIARLPDLHTENQYSEY
jgi:hypothetical protein